MSVNLVKEEAIDISRVCRTCMKDGANLLDVFRPMDNISEAKLLIADILMVCTPVKLCKTDGLPHNVCNECLATLTTVYSFRKQCELSEKTLQTYLDSARVPVEVPVIAVDRIVETNVKEEFPLNDNLFSFKQEKEEIDDRFEDDIPDFIDDYTVSLAVKTDSKLKRYECDECGKTFTKLSRLQKHLTKHTKSVNHLCHICNKSFAKTSGLDRHMVVHDAENKPFECTTCFQRFKREALLIRHLVIHTNSLEIKKEDDQEGHFPCQECPAVFTARRSLSSHMRKHKENHSKGFKCYVCEKEFSSKNPLNRHMKLHSNNRPYKCNICSKRYSRQEQLVDHINKHNGVKPNKCPYCSKAFSQLCNLKDHLRTHTGETPFLCSECGKGFNNGSNLRQHMLRHTGAKPFSCNLCPKKFSTKGQMTCHTSTHTGAHPYVCDTCGSSFTKPNSLKKHKLIHLGVKPFECDVCVMRFSCKDHLKRHYRIHTGEKPYKCQYCERAFTQSNDLVKHTRAHVGQNIYQCTVCNVKFRLLSELKQHYPSHYLPGDQPPPLIEVCKDMALPVQVLKAEQQPQTRSLDTLDEQQDVKIPPDEINLTRDLYTDNVETPHTQNIDRKVEPVENLFVIKST